MRDRKNRSPLPSVSPAVVADNPALDDDVPMPDADAVASPILIAPSKPTKAEVIDDLKKQKKSARDRARYLEKKIEKKDSTIDDGKKKVKDLIKNETRLSLLEAAAQARATELKASPDKLAATL